MGRIAQKLKIKSRVHVERAEKRISQLELADAIGVTRATIHAIESGDYNPSLELAFRLARYFGVGVESLFSASDPLENINAEVKK
jgi:putative transcriptional regulator